MGNEVQLTQLLNDWSEGNEASGNKIKSIIYYHAKGVIRKLNAERAKKDSTHDGSRSIKSLPNTTSFLHDVLLNLVPPLEQLEKRQQFYSHLALYIRRMMVDEIRCRNAQKNGGDVEFTSLTQLLIPNSLDAFIIFDSAISRLQLLSEKAAKIIEWHYFAGLSVDQIVQELKMTKHDVYQELKAGKAFIRTQLELNVN